MKLNQDILRQFSNFIAIIAAFVTNILANIYPLNGLTIGEISNTIFKDVLITPANYAFAIWGVIYLGLISFAIYQALPSQKQNSILRKIGYLLVISSFAQIIWVVLFQFQYFGLSVVAMLVILIPLTIIYLRLKPEFSNARLLFAKSFSRQEKWLINIPISIYFAWISVATIVNMASFLDYWDWDGWGISPQIWTVIMIIIATAIAIIVTIKYSDIAYGGVFIWALVAITIRHLDSLTIAGTAGVGAVILFLLILKFLNIGKYRRFS